VAIKLDRYFSQPGVAGQPVAPYVQASDNMLGGLAQTAQSVASFVEKRAAAQRQVDLLKAENGAKSDLAALEFEIEQDPDYRTAEQRYMTRAGEIARKYSEGLTDPLTKEEFGARAQSYLQTQALNVRKAAWGKEKNDAAATLDEATAQAVRQAAASRNDLEERQAIDGALRSISSMQAAGYLTPKEAQAKIQGLRQDVEGYKVLRVVNSADPQRALETLTDPSQLPWLDPKQREAYIGRVQTRLEIQQRQEIAAAEKAERDADRNLRRAQTTTEAVLIGRIAGGEQISENLLADLARKQQISDEGWRMLRGELRARGEGVDNPGVVIDLTNRLVGGDNIHDALLRERAAGNLSRNTLSDLMKDNERRQTGERKEEWKSAEEREQFQYMSKYLGSDKLAFSFDDDTAQRLATAQREYRDRVRLGQESPRDIANDIVAKYARTVRQPVSTYYDEPRSRQEGAAAATLLKQKFDAGLISREVYAREMQALNAKIEALPPAPPEPAKGTARQNKAGEVKR
jgi:ribosomal protein S30